MDGAAKHHEAHAHCLREHRRDTVYRRLSKKYVRVKNDRHPI